MPTGNMMELALALRDSLEERIPALVAEVNAAKQPAHPIVAPASGQVLLGIRTEMIKRELEELPAIACGVYVRQAVELGEGEQNWTEVMMPYVIDIYIGDTDANSLYIKAHKWGQVFDLFIERYGSKLLKGYWCDEAPDLDISYVLELRDGTFRQLISATGIFMGVE